jgi:hypothetical protein
VSELGAHQENDVALVESEQGNVAEDGRGRQRGEPSEWESHNRMQSAWVRA